MASIWKQYSEETNPEGGFSKPPIVTINEDFAVPISSSKTKDFKPLNKGKNAKTASRSGSVERRLMRGCIRQNQSIHGQNVMAGSRLTRHRLLKYFLASFKKEPAAVELQDMSSYLPSDFSPCDRRPYEPEENPHGEVIFFHYNSDGTDYTCTSVPISSPKASRKQRDTGDMKCRSSSSSESTLIIECSDSEEEEEEEEEKVIEAVLIQDIDHNSCACTRFSSNLANDGCSVDVESSSFINRPLCNEYTAGLSNGNINSNCLQDEGAAGQIERKRRTSTLRMPKILKKRKVKFALPSTNHKYTGPRILGSEDGDEPYHTVKQTGTHKRLKQRETTGANADDTIQRSCSWEPFEWPDNYIDVKVPLRWTPPGLDSDMETYMTVASTYVPTVYVKLYVQVPPKTHLCELKTHLLICIFRSFFTTTEGLHITWVMSLQSHVYNLLYMDVARVRFRRDSSGRPCRACLLLSKDATTLVRHKRCCLLTTVTDILQIAPEELLVLEKEPIKRWSDVEKITNGRKTLNHAVR